MKNIVNSFVVIAALAVSANGLAENYPCPNPASFKGLGEQLVAVDGVVSGVDKGRWAKTMPIQFSDGHMWSVNIGPIADPDPNHYDQDAILKVGREQIKNVLPANPSVAQWDRGLAVYVCHYPTTGGVYRAELFLDDVD